MPHRNDHTARALRADPAYAFAVHGLLDLSGPWAGWKLRGRWLVSPGGDRTNARELSGLLFLKSGCRVGPDGPNGTKREASP